jgi:hypothetical protein
MVFGFLKGDFKNIGADADVIFVKIDDTFIAFHFYL